MVFVLHVNDRHGGEGRAIIYCRARFVGHIGELPAKNLLHVEMEFLLENAFVAQLGVIDKFRCNTGLDIERTR
jgi:hypothetical protein